MKSTFKLYGSIEFYRAGKLIEICVVSKRGSLGFLGWSTSAVEQIQKACSQLAHKCPVNDFVSMR